MLSANLKLRVLEEIEVSTRASNLAFSALPNFVVTKITPLAPRAPYTAVAVASFNTEKALISSGCKRAKSVELDSTPSIKINGSTLPAPNEPTPRTKNCALSCPGSPEL